MKLKALIAITGLLTTTFCFAATTADYSWVAKFKVGPNHDHTISHDAKYVCFDGFICGGKGMNISAGSSINGWVATKDLSLKRESTKDEFVASMVAAELYPIETN